MQSQVRCHRVPEKVPEKVPGGFDGEQVEFRERGRVLEKVGGLWCRARSGSTGFAVMSFTETQLRCF